MHTIRLLDPIVSDRRALFRWTVDPAVGLYRQTEFSLTFPDCVDLAKVPRRLWYDLAMICLHPHWLLLRPCEIHLPLRLSPGERQFWLELLRTALETLEANGSRQPTHELGIAIVAGDREIGRETIAGSAVAASFSSGKDSLLQAALLCELGTRPLLVTTTSPLPPLADHLTRRRRDVLQEIQTRTDATLVEVESDFRAITDNAFAASLGYHIAVSELTDVFLYTASLLAAGMAFGRSRFFVASEAEAQENAVCDGRIVQHHHFMYSAATQRALSALLAPYGIRLGSLIWPLYSMQVQQLLWSRYPDLSDLQYSCWQVGPDQATCSACEQCFRIAVTALAGGHDPQRMGIDLAKVLAFAPSWEAHANANAARPPLPEKAGALRSDARVYAAVRKVSLRHLAELLSNGKGARTLPPERLAALSTFREFQDRARRAGGSGAMGVREAYFEWLDPDLRDRLVAIYTSHFPREPRYQHAGTFLRSRALADRMQAALA